MPAAKTGGDMTGLIALVVWLLMGIAILGWGIYRFINKRRQARQ
jgi:hypothetical protein